MDSGCWTNKSTITFDASDLVTKITEIIKCQDINNFKKLTVEKKTNGQISLTLKRTSTNLNVEPVKRQIESPTTIDENKRPRLEDVATISGTELVFNNDFNEPLESIIPKNITHVVFGEKFDQFIVDNNFPSGIKSIIFGKSFNKPVYYNNVYKNISYIPQGVTHLVFGEDYDRSLPRNSLRESITHLTLGKSFNKNLDYLPKNLSHLFLHEDILLKYIDEVPETVHVRKIKQASKNWDRDCQDRKRQIEWFGDMFLWFSERELKTFLESNGARILDDCRLKSDIVVWKYRAPYFCDKLNSAIEPLSHFIIQYNIDVEYNIDVKMANF